MSSSQLTVARVTTSFLFVANDVPFYRGTTFMWPVLHSTSTQGLTTWGTLCHTGLSSGTLCWVLTCSETLGKCLGLSRLLQPHLQSESNDNRQGYGDN